MDLILHPSRKPSVVIRIVSIKLTIRCRPFGQSAIDRERDREIEGSSDLVQYCNLQPGTWELAAKRRRALTSLRNG